MVAHHQEQDNNHTPSCDRNLAPSRSELGGRDNRHVVHYIVLGAIALVFIVLGAMRLVPQWFSFSCIVIISIIMYRVYKKWEASGPPPLWYSVWRRLWCGFAGAVDCSLAGVVLMVIMSSVVTITWEDVVRAALVGGVLGAAVGLVWPRVIETFGVPLY
jgi:RsiW-degrading membrane proteinase PrsW (M82 family)